MFRLHKGFNSKAFLLIYLVLVGLILLVWAGRFPVFKRDDRKIPPELVPYLTSPPRKIPQVLLYQNNKQVLTNDWFLGKWSFVYFSYSHCLPICKPVYGLLDQLRDNFANHDVQFLVVGIDTEHEQAEQLAQFVKAQAPNVFSATGSKEMIDKLARVFPALFLISYDSKRKNYQIDEEHDIFLVDPKGRVYAVFEPPLSLSEMQSVFVQARQFYALSE